MDSKKSTESLKQQAESFFTSAYPESFLFSHGIEHHRRVWNYAQEIVEAGYINLSVDDYFISNLLVACYFHDIGMAENQGKNHGTASRKKCMEFLKAHKLNPDDYQEALDAIEFHDDKTYRASKTSNQTLAILSVADDLDAFGFIGIYRYADIYLRRNINKTDIGKMVLENAAGRFQNFIRNKKSDNAFFEKHTKRYDILNQFFLCYNEEIKCTNTELSGYGGVIEIINSLINCSGKPDFQKIFSKRPDDCVIKWFSEGILKEIENNLT